jgi:hypothetical protein
MLNWAFGDEKEREDADKLKTRPATPKMKIPADFKGSLLFSWNLFFVLPPSSKTLFPGPDGDVKPVLLRGERTGISFIVLTERIVSSIEIDQHLCSGHRLDIEIASLPISLYP